MIGRLVHLGAAVGLALAMLWPPLSASAADPRAPDEGARVSDTTTSTTSSDAAISWDTEVSDDGSYFTSSAATRLTVARAGWCSFGGTLHWTADSGNGRWFSVRLNGSTLIAEVSSHADTAHNDPWQTLAAGYLFAASDYIEFLVRNNDGATITVNTQKGWITCEGPTVTPQPIPTPGGGPAASACATPQASSEADCVVEVVSFTGDALDTLQLQTFALVVVGAFSVLMLAWIAVGNLRR